ncbi:MAG: 30S ribosomal protein S15 [Candidatus Micrarchaeota archaeon]
MARMHSRRRGRSKSHKPSRSSANMWVTISKEEIEDKVVELAKEGRREAEIGLILRDQFAVPSIKAMTGKTVSQLLKEKGHSPKYPSDLIDLIRKAVKMRKHLAENKKDRLNSKKLVDTESKIKRLVNYYRGKKLPKNWKYDPEQAALLVK